MKNPGTAICPSPSPSIRSIPATLKAASGVPINSSPLKECTHTTSRLNRNVSQ